MSLKTNDLRDMVDHIIEIDSFKSKMGDDEDIVVITLSTRTYESARDLVNFIEKGYEYVLDADATPGEQSDKTYKVFVELERKKDSAENVISMMEDMKSLTGIQNFKFRYYKNFKSYPLTFDNLKLQLPTTSSMYKMKIKESYMENYKNFFSRSFVESIDMLDDFITIKKIYADPLHFKFVNFDNVESALEEIKESFNFNDFGEIIFLTKYIGDYNISKYGNKLLIENEGKALVVERVN
jgi:hypothetical protein